MQPDTIFALATAPGRAGVSVMRVSGPLAGLAVTELSRRALPAPRLAVLRTVRDASGTKLDEPLVLWFPGPNSFTGEDVVEFQIHGSAAIIAALSAELIRLGLRQAGPGEFTRRAVENGRMDLTEAEGLADLIDANTEGQRVQALQQMEGGLRQTYEGWRDGLLDALAQIEGEIDFADEADVPDALSHAAWPYLERVEIDMARALDQSSQARAVRDGISVVIVGAPNAGKSTLLNTLVGRDVAITSTQAGTTRDIVEAQTVMAGLPVIFADTAGLRETQDEIEAEGVRRAIERTSEAHITLFMYRLEHEGDNIDASDMRRAADKVICNVSKSLSEAPLLDEIMLNALSGDGVGDLRAWLYDKISTEFSGLEPSTLTRQRHVRLIQAALGSVTKAKQALSIAPELASEDIRSGLGRLEELAGRSDMEQVFDRIFSSFCIGK